MRVRCSDDVEVDIMDSVDDLALSLDDELINQPGEPDMTAKKKETPAEEPKTTKKNAKTEAKADKAAGAKKEGKKELPKGFGPREIPEGHTGLDKLAEACGRTPASCRRILRAAEVEKPEGQHGWYWKDGSKALASVQKLLAKKEEAEA